MEKGMLMVSSPEDYAPVDGGGAYRSRLERGLAKKGYRREWRRHDYEGELGLSSLKLTILDERYLRVRSRSITFRREHRSEADIAEAICEELVEGGGRIIGEPIRYGSN
jgi:hypothetical protein